MISWDDVGYGAMDLYGGPIEGESYTATFTDPDAPERQTQFYSMLGMRSIYHEGWLATALHPALSGWANYPLDEWELYNLREDRAQANNVADQQPEKLQELIGLWFYNAGLYNEFPVDDRTAMEQLNRERPESGKPRSRYIYYPDTAEVPESVAVAVKGRDYTIAAAVKVKSENAEGVLFAQGGVGGGHTLYIKDGMLTYLFNWLGEKHQYVRASAPITTGRHVFTAEFKKTGSDEATRSAMGTLKLFIDMEQVGEAEIQTQPGTFALAGDGLGVGKDGGSPVSPEYGPPFEFHGGEIERVVVDVSGDLYVDHETGSDALVEAGLTRGYSMGNVNQRRQEAGSGLLFSFNGNAALLDYRVALWRAPIDTLIASHVAGLNQIAPQEGVILVELRQPLAELLLRPATVRVDLLGHPLDEHLSLALLGWYADDAAVFHPRS